MKYALILLMFTCGLAVKACDKADSSGSKSGNATATQASQTASSTAKTSSKTAPSKTAAGKTQAVKKPAPKPVDSKVADTKVAAEDTKKPAGKCDGPCPCADGSKNKKDDSWTRCTLSEAAKIQGYHCAAGRLTFHKEGQLEECNFVNDTKVGEYTCRKAPNSVKLHASGKLAACSVAEAAEIGGFKYKRYAGIRLFEDGSPQTAFLKEGSKEIAGFQCTKAIRLFEGGKLQTCTLGSDAKVGGKKIASGYQLILNKDGSLRGLRNWSGKVKYAGKSYGKGKAGALLCFTDGKPDPASRACSYF